MFSSHSKPYTRDSTRWRHTHLKPRNTSEIPHHLDGNIRFPGLESGKSSEKVIILVSQSSVLSDPSPLGIKSQSKPLKKRNWAWNAWIKAFRNHPDSNVVLTNKLLSSSQTASPHSQARLLSCTFSRLFLKTPPQLLKVTSSDKLVGERVRCEDRKPTIPQHHRSWTESRATVRRHQQHTGAVCWLPHTRPPYILSLYSCFSIKNYIILRNFTGHSAYPYQDDRFSARKRWFWFLHFCKCFRLLLLPFTK